MHTHGMQNVHNNHQTIRQCSNRLAACLSQHENDIRECPLEVSLQVSICPISRGDRILGNGVLIRDYHASFDEKLLCFCNNTCAPCSISRYSPDTNRKAALQHRHSHRNFGPRGLRQLWRVKTNNDDAEKESKDVATRSTRY